jgi:hypothetical protein
LKPVEKSFSVTPVFCLIYNVLGGLRFPWYASATNETITATMMPRSVLALCDLRASARAMYFKLTHYRDSCHRNIGSS